MSRARTRREGRSPSLRFSLGAMPRIISWTDRGIEVTSRSPRLKRARASARTSTARSFFRRHERFPCRHGPGQIFQRGHAFCRGRAEREWRLPRARVVQCRRAKRLHDRRQSGLRQRDLANAHAPQRRRRRVFRRTKSPGRHYGFPPRHPRHLPGVIDDWLAVAVGILKQLLVRMQTNPS